MPEKYGWQQREVMNVTVAATFMQKMAW